MHSAIVVINMPDRHEREAQHPNWLAYLADLSRASEPVMTSLLDQDGVIRLAEMSGRSISRAIRAASPG